MARTMTRSSPTWCRNTPVATLHCVGPRRERQAEIGDDLVDGGDEPVEILRLECADTADAEAWRPGQLAGIDDETARRQRGVEVVEAEAGMLWRHEGDDDRRLDALVEKGTETESRHPVRQGPEILAVALQPRGRPPGAVEKAQRLNQRGDNLHRRREPPLPVRLEAAPLI